MFASRKSTIEKWKWSVIIKHKSDQINLFRLYPINQTLLNYSYQLILVWKEKSTPNSFKPVSIWQSFIKLSSSSNTKKKKKKIAWKSHEWESIDVIAVVDKFQLEIKWLTYTEINNILINSGKKLLRKQRKNAWSI